MLIGAVGPVGLVGALQSRAQSLHRFDLFFSACEIASARHAETAREADQGIRHRILGCVHRQRGRAGPVRPFQDIARRHSGLCGKIAEANRTVAAVGGGQRFADHRIGFGVLRELQMRIDGKIRRVIVVGLDLKRRCVRGDGFFPKSDHGVDMRRHVPRVRYGRRNARIAPRRGNSFFGKRRKVVGMNEVVRHARMLRVLVEELLQKRRGFDLVGIGQVAFLRRGLQRQRIIDLHLVIVGIALRHALHRGIVGCQSGTHGNLVMVAEIGAQRLDPVALTLRLRPGHPRFFQRVPSRLRVGPRRRGCQGVAEVIHRQTPVCHRAGGILL